MGNFDDVAKDLMRGKTDEQKKVIKYLLDYGGCLSSTMKSEEYDSIVQTKVKSLNLKQKALNKIGLDEAQVREIEPVNFEGFYFDNKSWAKKGEDGSWRSQSYEVTWIFFSTSQIYFYKYFFSLIDDFKKESTEEYFYKDITNFSTSEDTIEIKKQDKKQEIGYKTFTIVVPGDKIRASIDFSEKNERAIQGMKSKLREKKG